jgi:hypothetical protein
MKIALYFGSLGDGHFLHGIPLEIRILGRSIDPTRDVPGFPWSAGLCDGGLLNNARAIDEPDGRVFWTVGGINVLWHAFFWWDRSSDRRGASNSGFYVRGFPIGDRDAAFELACQAWPQVVARQLHPLVLQPVRPGAA